MIGTLLTAQNIAREKELGTLEQLNVTPMTRGPVHRGQAAAVLGAGADRSSRSGWRRAVVFGVPDAGQPAARSSGRRRVPGRGAGHRLWISTGADTQQQAMFVTFFIMMIYLLMSGLFTPIDSMPRLGAGVAQVNPVRHFVTIMRAVLMRARGSRRSGGRSSASALPGVVVLALAVMRYRKSVAGVGLEAPAARRLEAALQQPSVADPLRPLRRRRGSGRATPARRHRGTAARRSGASPDP